MTEENGITREQAELLKQECNNKVELAEALYRLEGNPDFKKVFIEHYSKDEAVRLVHLLGDQTINMGNQKEAFRKDIEERMIGISRFAEYMRNSYRIAEQAMKTLNDLSQAESEYENSLDITKQ